MDGLSNGLAGGLGFAFGSLLDPVSWLIVYIMFIVFRGNAKTRSRFSFSFMGFLYSLLVFVFLKVGFGVGVPLLWASVSFLVFFYQWKSLTSVRNVTDSNSEDGKTQGIDLVLKEPDLEMYVDQEKNK